MAQCSKIAEAHQMIQPLEKLLNIIRELSLMGILLFQVSLKQSTDACSIYQCQVISSSAAGSCTYEYRVGS